MVVFLKNSCVLGQDDDGDRVTGGRRQEACSNSSAGGGGSSSSSSSSCSGGGVADGCGVDRQLYSIGMSPVSCYEECL